MSTSFMSTCLGRQQAWCAVQGTMSATFEAAAGRLARGLRSRPVSLGRGVTD